ncbi:MAG: DUF1553 domain-containing protein, partial [Planctomycetales bacterium]|nr:DUF1553 domain-containing protein [Planctomycetales bacterium]
NDTDPRAYEKLIDRLLESPHYGERWGRHWLDVARFAESHGFEQDYDRPHAYHYRDFVIRALNDDMPYDQFVRWQLAGDEIAPDNPLAMMATGFLGAGVFPTQLTEKEFEPARYDELDDMVSTMGTSMLGLTVGCARCHDHKFDPVPMADYYRLIATFATTIRSNIELELDPEATREALAAWQREHEPLAAELAKFEREQLPARFDAWLADRDKESSEFTADWMVLDLSEFKSRDGATLTKQADGSLLASGKNPDFDQYTLTATTQLRNITAIRLEALAHDSFVKGGPGRASNGNMGLGNFTVRIEPLSGSEPAQTIKLVDPRATFQQNTGNLSIAASIDDNPKTGWAVDPQFGKDHAAVFHAEQPFGFDGGTKLTITLQFNVNNQHNIGRPRLSLSTAPAPVGLDGKSESQAVVELLRLLDGDARPTAEQREKLIAWYRTLDPEWRKLQQRVADHLAAKPQPKMTTVMVASEGVKPIPHHADGRGFPHFYKETFFLQRGDVNQKQGVAPTGFLQALMRSPESASESELSTAERLSAEVSHWQVEPPEGWRTSYRRRALANWITDTEYGAGHLLARVIVNRVWHHHFGHGIVATPNDFGYQGQRPTYPELLDWLASQLIADGWRLKSLHKRMMTSAAYMQTGEFDSEDSRIDPDNHYFWRYEPQRLEAEVIRDAMLAVGGRLDATQFGPGSLDPNMNRRSIYFMIKRSRLVPMMQIFDAPEPLVSVGNRPATTIAPQALHFLNNDQVRSAARTLAARVHVADAPEVSIQRAYLTALAREPTAAEQSAAVAFVAKQMQSYQADGKQPAAELALADFCQVLLSLNEFIYID